MKGHNYGLCKKCGKNHKHPKGMLNKKQTKNFHMVMQGKPGWSKGLTKHTDERVAKSAKKMKGRKHTVEHNQKIREAKLGKSNNHKPSCQCSWCKAKRGKLVKEKNHFYGKHHTDETKSKLRKANIGNPSNKGKKLPTLMGNLNPSKRPEVKAKIRLKAKQRFEDELWRTRMIIGGGRKNGKSSVESKEHFNTKIETKEFLEKLGYNVNLEHLVKVEQKLYIIDVVGFKGNENIAVECGKCYNKKLENLKTKFSKVLHIPIVGDTEACLKNVW